MKTVWPYLALLLMVLSCTHEEVDDAIPDEYLFPDEVSHDMIVLGRKLEDPYAVDNVEAALKSAYPTKSFVSLEPTDLYVRFLPETEDQYDRLLSMGLVFFDHPMDYEILKEGDYYHDPEVDEDHITWQYAVVPSHFVLPLGIRHEIIDRCYIPGNAETKSVDDVDWDLVEQEAFRLTGNADLLGPEVRGGNSAAARPSGRITVVDGRHDGGAPVGVAGVKVSCNTFVKIASAYTDAEGYYEMEREFSSSLRYRLVFQNEKGFAIGLNKILVPASTSALGKGGPEGISACIDASSDRNLFCRTVVNNAAWDYYDKCSVESSKIPSPPSDTRLWIFQFLDASSTMMLQHGAMIDDTKIGEFLGGFKSIAKMFLPDITLGLNGADEYSTIYSITVHELAHASHFSQVGKSFWDRYIMFVLTSFASSGGRMYGTGGEQDAGYCEVGEMWAYFIQNVLYQERYGEDSPVFGTSFWFHPQILLYLAERGVGKSMIGRALTPEVTSGYLLQEKLEELYPEYGMLIDQAFERYSD